MTDPIADMLTRIRNAYLIQKKKTIVPFSKFKLAILVILKKEGYILDFKQRQKKVLVYLKYNEDGKGVIREIKRISSPGRRVYLKSKDIKPIRQGVGTIILSTPDGIFSGKEAKRKGAGGEVICEIW